MRATDTGIDWSCRDCEVDTRSEYFMVHDSLWVSAGIRKDGGFLCVSCLETRLNRTLVKSDFTDCPLNEMDFKRTERLNNRMGITNAQRT